MCKILLALGSMIGFAAVNLTPAPVQAKVLVIGSIAFQEAPSTPMTMMSIRDWPEFQETTTGTGQAGSDSGSQDPELIEKLRALGYIE